MRFAPDGIIFSPVEISCSATDALPGSRCSFFYGVHFYYGVSLSGVELSQLLSVNSTFWRIHA
jgi:hypothetical protein